MKKLVPIKVLYIILIILVFIILTWFMNSQNILNFSWTTVIMWLVITALAVFLVKISRVKLDPENPNFTSSNVYYLSAIVSAKTIACAISFGIFAGTTAYYLTYYSFYKVAHDSMIPTVICMILSAVSVAIDMYTSRWIYKTPVN